MTPPENSARLPYLPSLDGLRGVAVAAVLLFHADVAWMRGGHLGVTAFFTLSGFLITSLLLLEKQHTGSIGLRAFWARRARRLVPAMVLCFGLVAAVVALSESVPPRGLIGDAVAAATWSANWRFIFDEQTYADIFSAESPFQHFWSLAVEEQFYVVFPLLAAAVLGGRRLAAGRGRLAVVLGALVVASTVQVARLHDPDAAIGRAYYGTDARIAEILVGAVLALALVGPSGITRLTGAARRLVGVMGAAGLVGLAIAFVVLGDHDTRLYEGGFLAVALCTAALIAAAVQPGSVVGRLLANPPMVALGKVSYGAYLFHWPVFLLLTERSTAMDPGQLLVVRVLVTVALAAGSYWLVEAPIRYGRMPAGVGLVGWANGATLGLALVVLASGQVVAPGPDPAVAEQSAIAVPPPPGAQPEVAPGQPGGDGSVSALGAAGANPVPSPQGQPPVATTTPQSSSRPAAPPGFFEDPAKAKVPARPAVPPGALRVAVVGDSIGVNLGRGLRIWAEERGDVAVYNLAFAACPLSRDGVRRFGDGDPFLIARECSWWDDASSERRQAFEAFAPDVVVVQDGLNEMFDRKLPDWEDYRRPGDARYDQWLRDEYQLAFSGWAASGAAIVVTNAPCADWERYEQWRGIEDPDLRIQALNLGVYRGLIDVTLADLFERICPGGQYRDDVEGVSDGRPDGFHLSDEAAAALARRWLGPIVLDAAAARESSAPLPVEPAPEPAP